MEQIKEKFPSPSHSVVGELPDGHALVESSLSRVNVRNDQPDRHTRPPQPVSLVQHALHYPRPLQKLVGHPEPKSHSHVGSVQQALMPAPGPTVRVIAESFADALAKPEAHRFPIAVGMGVERTQAQTTRAWRVLDVREDEVTLQDPINHTIQEVSVEKLQQHLNQDWILRTTPSLGSPAVERPADTLSEK
jgi:hypothetical protein